MYSFWANNKLDQHFVKSADEITDGFVQSEIFENYKSGWPLSRALSVYLGTLGATESNEFEPLLNDVKRILRTQYDFV